MSSTGANAACLKAKDGAFSVGVHATGPANCPDPCTDDVDVIIGEGAEESEDYADDNLTIRGPPDTKYQYVRWAKAKRIVNMGYLVMGVLTMQL